MKYAAAREWEELIIQTHSPAFMTSGMSHRIYGPLQFHSCKTNNGSAWLNCTKYRISPKIPMPRGKQRMEIFCANIPRMEIIWKSPCCLSSYQATDICSPVCGKSWHISNRCWHIFRNPGISRISASYLKAHPASVLAHLKISSSRRVFDMISPHMAFSFRGWQTAFKWLTYGRTGICRGRVTWELGGLQI